MPGFRATVVSVVILASSACGQNPFEAIVGAGAGMAMTVGDIISQGAAIRGSSDTEIDVLGQRVSDSRNGETGFGQAIQLPDTRRRRSAIETVMNRKDGNGKRRTTPDDTALRRVASKLKIDFSKPFAGNYNASSFKRQINNLQDRPTSPAPFRREKREAVPCGRGASRSRTATTTTTTVEPETRRKRAAEPCDRSASTTADVPLDRKKRDVDELNTDQLQAALQRFMDTARGLADKIKAVFEGDGSKLNDQAEMI